VHQKKKLSIFVSFTLLFSLLQPIFPGQAIVGSESANRQADWRRRVANRAALYKRHDRAAFKDVLNGRRNGWADLSAKANYGEKQAKKRPEFVPGELIVKFAPNVSVNGASGLTGSGALNTLKRQLRVSRMSRIFNHAKGGPAAGRLRNIYRVKISKKTNVLAAVKDYLKNSQVIYAEPNFIVKADVVPDDPYYSSSGAWGQPEKDMWGLHSIDTSAAWDVEQGSTSTVVAVVDTGLDYNHPEIDDQVWINPGESGGGKETDGVDNDLNGYVDDVNGWNFASDTNDVMDDVGHGTHVAGTIAAETNNSTGVAGVSWNSKIMPVKFLDADGNGTMEGGALGIQYAADNGARVINNSWGGPRSELVDDAVDYAHAAGAVVVAAAGNFADDSKFYSPAGANNALTVAASDQNDQAAEFTNYGAAVEVSAPGVDILSLRAAGTDMYGDGTHIVDGNYYYASGTSMAAPHVSGLAALLASQNTTWTNEEIMAQISGTSDNIDANNPPEQAGWFGTGRINAYEALAGTPRTALRYYSQTASDSPGGDGDGIVDPGEDITLAVELRNIAAPASSVSATLSTEDPSVTITKDVASFTDMGAWKTGNNDADQFAFTVDPTTASETVIPFKLHVTANGGSYEETVSVDVVVDAIAPYVTEVYPGNDSTGYDAGSYFAAFFSEPLRAGSATTQTAYLRQDGGITDVPATVWDWSVWGWPEVDIMPDAPMVEDTSYTATLAAGIKDAPGNPMGADYNSSFKTGVRAPVTDRWAISQITSDTTDEVVTDINDGGQIVGGRWDGHDLEIFLMDGTTTTQITNNDDYKWPPMINNAGQIVWSVENGYNLDIYLYDGGVTTKINDTAGFNFLSGISDAGQVVWEGFDGNDGEIYMYEGGVEKKITDNGLDDFFARVNSAGQVVWNTFDMSDTEIYLYDDGLRMQLTSNNVEDWLPSISDNGYIAWNRFDGNDDEIYRYKDGVTEQITDNDQSDQADQVNNNGAIVGSRFRNGYGNSYLWNADGEHRLTFSSYGGGRVEMNNKGAVVFGAPGATDEGMKWLTFVYDGSGVKRVNNEDTWSFALNNANRIVMSQTTSQTGSYDVFIADPLLPETALTVAAADGANGWYKTKPSVTLTPDITATTFYSVDNTSLGSTYSGPLTIQEGIHTLNYRSVDAIDNAESMKSKSFKVDKTKPTGTISINSGAAETNSTAVVLGLISGDGAGSGVVQMRFSNDGAVWSAWEPVLSTKAWILTAGDGAKTVYVQHKDGAGNISDAVSDAITLKTPAAAPLPIASKLILSAKPKTVALGKASLLTGKLLDSTGKGLVGKQVKIKAGKKTIKILTTTTGGAFKLKVKPTKKTIYKAVFDGDAGAKTSASTGVTVKVE